MSALEEYKIYWIDRKRNRISIKDMDTPYLYNTVKMIWNNTLYPSQPFGEVIRWSFHGVHTFEYLLEFYMIGFAQLKLRKDNQVAQKFIDHVEKHVGDMFKQHEKRILNSLRFDGDCDAYKYNESEMDFGDKD